MEEHHKGAQKGRWNFFHRPGRDHQWGKVFFLNLYNNEEEFLQEDMAEMVKDIPQLVKPEDIEALESPISEEEIKRAIWSLHPDKAREPNG